MATVNKRIIQGGQAHVINGVSAGGLVTHAIQAGYDDILQHPVDGYMLPMTDLVTEFVRGNFISQDWVQAILLLTGTLGTSVFYQRKSGVADATGYIKHTLYKPVIHKFALTIEHRKYATVNASYECQPASETGGIADLWTQTDGQNAPTQINAARGLEITACALASLSIYHIVRLEFSIELPLMKFSADGDIGYTTIDAVLNGMKAYGTLTFQDADITTSQNKALQLLKAARGALVLSIKQSQGATAKTLTLNGVKFTSLGHNTTAPESGAVPGADEYSMPFIITNNTTTPLTLAGANKIITIA